MNIEWQIIVAIASEIATCVGVLITVAKWLKRVVNGQLCQLRADMLHTYYRNKDGGKIRQYEFENFLAMYDAYTALGGNSFILKIHDEVKTWEVIT